MRIIFTLIGVVCGVLGFQQGIAQGSCVDTVKYVDNMSTGDPTIDYEIIGGVGMDGAGNYRIDAMYQRYYYLDGKVNGVTFDARNVSSGDVTLTVSVWSTDNSKSSDNTPYSELGSTTITISPSSMMETHVATFATPIDVVYDSKASGTFVSVGNPALALTDSILIATSKFGETEAGRWDQAYNHYDYSALGNIGGNEISEGLKNLMIRPIIDLDLTPDFSTGPVDICVGDSIALDMKPGSIKIPVDKSTETIYNTYLDKLYEWNYGDGSAVDSTAPNFQYYVFTAPSTDVTLTNFFKGYTNSCSESLTIPVNVLAVPTADFVSPDNGSLTVNFTDASINATEWSWDFGDGNTSNSQNPSHAYVSNGTYEVELTAGNGICSNIITKTIVFSVGLRDELSNGYSFYPNPATDKLNISIDNVNENVTIQIFNLIGAKIFEKGFERMNNVKSVDISDLPNGKYIIKLEMGETTLTRSFLKQ